jgi:hypothetical protein
VSFCICIFFSFLVRFLRICLANLGILLLLYNSVGTFVVSTLLHATPETRNRPLCVNSFTTSPAEIQSLFERHIPGPWNVSYTPLERLRELEGEAWGAGNPAATVVTLRRIWSEGGTLYEKRANELIGEPKTSSLEEVVAREVRRSSSL